MGLEIRRKIPCHDFRSAEHGGQGPSSLALRGKGHQHEKTMPLWKDAALAAWTMASRLWKGEH
jgi:hypothetical protein